MGQHVGPTSSDGHPDGAARRPGGPGPTAAPRRGAAEGEPAGAQHAAEDAQGPGELLISGRSREVGANLLLTFPTDHPV